MTRFAFGLETLVILQRKHVDVKISHVLERSADVYLMAWH
jgi:hypothetical protein